MSADENKKPETRIQKRNREAILDGALDVFSAHGFRGSTLDQIAAAAGLSKPNLLYYFGSKELIHETLLTQLMDTWLDPLRQIDAAGDPVEELLDYVGRKLEMSRKYPRESRLFANEILQGAPRIGDLIGGSLKGLVDEKAAVIADWSAAGRLAVLDPHHLIFSIWATTQHYADFAVQVDGILGHTPAHNLDTANQFLRDFYQRALTPT